MPEEYDDLLKRLEKKHLDKGTPETPGGKKGKGRLSRWFSRIFDTVGDFLNRHTKSVTLAIAVIMIALVGLFLLAQDYLTKRQNYPERNVLFRATNVVYIAGGSEGKGTENIDQSSETQVYEGGGIESKVGTYLFMTTRESRDDIEYFNMDNFRKIRIASATRKPEIVQAGLRLGGSLNFKEQLAEIIPDGASKAPQSYHVYKFVPERGLKEIEVTVVEQADGSMRLDNRMTELREYLLGWFWGKEFRRGTFLENYRYTLENAAQIQQFYESIKILDSQSVVERSAREQMVRKVMNLSDAIETFPIYMTFEDGFFDWFPQDSTIYLAHTPTTFERFKDAVVGKSAHVRLRAETYKDFFPGQYPLLRSLHFGKGDNVVYPFDKHNNGGYVIHDMYGALAQIDIQDFILFYGQDVLYSYYLDLNGDGKIEKETELLGTVLCRATHDDRVNLEQLIGQGRPKTDVTFTTHYSFMSPTNDLEQGNVYFNLCGYIESMLPDQVNRGFGKHSFLGYINQQRSDIMLYKELTIENMSRALTQESTLVAKYDIVRALIAAQRPYAQEIATAFGVGEQFAGQFHPSNQLKERRDWRGIIILSAVCLVFGVLGYYMLRPARQTPDTPRQ